MKGLLDLKTLERDAFRRFYEDGLFDVFIALLLGAMAVSHIVAVWSESELLADAVMMGLSVAAVAILFTVRLRLLRSRLGDFKPGPERRRRIALTRLVLLLSLALGVAAFCLGAVAYGRDVRISNLELVVPLAWFLHATVVFGAMAYLLDVPRFFVWGVLLGAVGPLFIWPDAFWDRSLPPGTVFLLPALVIAGTGAYKLVHFLRDYPVPPRADLTGLHDAR